MFLFWYVVVVLVNSLSVFYHAFCSKTTFLFLICICFGFREGAESRADRKFEKKLEFYTSKWANFSSIDPVFGVVSFTKNCAFVVFCLHAILFLGDMGLIYTWARL